MLAYNAHGGAPRFLRRFEPSAVVLHTTFLAARWTRSFERWRDRSAWIGALGVPVIALPQDEYDHVRVLDAWLAELRTTQVFSVQSEEHAGFLYPRSSRLARVDGVLSGYVDESLARAAVAPLSERPLDLVYRATTLPPWFGRLGRLKAEVGRAAAGVADRRGLAADVAIDVGSEILGGDWLRFLASGRTVVGAESGASVTDPDGSLRVAVTRFLAHSPNATYDEIVEHVPGDWEDRWFAAVSPRHLEAAAVGSVQVLVEGHYSGVLVPGEHYVPVRRDLGDLDEALVRALEPEAAEIAERARDDLVSSGRYGSKRLTEAVRGALGMAPEAPRSSLEPAVRAAAAVAEHAARVPGRLRSALRV